MTNHSKRNVQFFKPLALIRSTFFFTSSSQSFSTAALYHSHSNTYTEIATSCTMQIHPANNNGISTQPETSASTFPIIIVMLLYADKLSTQFVSSVAFFLFSLLLFYNYSRIPMSRMETDVPIQQRRHCLLNSS